MAKFITSRRAVRFDDGQGGSFFIPVGYLGEVPGWVENHWYFKALCNDGTITALVDSKDRTLEKAEAESEAKKKAFEAVAEKKAEEDAAKAEVKPEPEKFKAPVKTQVTASGIKKKK